MNRVELLCFADGSMTGKYVCSFIGPNGVDFRAQLCNGQKFGNGFVGAEEVGRVQRMHSAWPTADQMLPYL